MKNENWSLNHERSLEWSYTPKCTISCLTIQSRKRDFAALRVCVAKYSIYLANLEAFQFDLKKM